MNISVAYENTICCFASISFEKIIKGGPEEEIMNDQTMDWIAWMGWVFS